MARRTTIRDIAAAANTSITAVSLTLNNRPNRLSEATKEHIREVAAQLHYVPNQSARNLVSKHSMLLGLIVPDIENAYFAKVSKQISDLAGKQGYTLVITNSNDSAATERALLSQFDERGIDGTILIPSLESFNAPGELRRAIEASSSPIVLMDRISALPWCDGVGIDNHRGGELVAQYLFDRGHRSVGVIAARSEYMHQDGRIEGFLHTMKRLGAHVPASRIAEGNFRYEGGYSTIESLLKQQVTAVFCGNDLTALGARKRILELGYSIPRDVSLVGYDNSMASQGIGADLTTVDQDIPLISEKAIQLLIRRIGEETGSSPLPGERNNTTDETSTEAEATSQKKWLVNPQKLMFSPKLVERATVSEPPQR